MCTYVARLRYKPSNGLTTKRYGRVNKPLYMTRRIWSCVTILGCTSTQAENCRLWDRQKPRHQNQTCCGRVSG